MPRRPRKPCGQPGCGQLVEAGQGYCPAHKREKQKRVDSERGTAHERGYTYQWSKARKRYLAANPICVECERQGILTAATEVDHIEPHKGDYDLFWDESNFQSLCKHCHSSKTAREDGGWGRPITPKP